MPRKRLPNGQRKPRQYQMTVPAKYRKRLDRIRAQMILDGVEVDGQPVRSLGDVGAALVEFWEGAQEVGLAIEFAAKNAPTEIAAEAQAVIDSHRPPPEEPAA